MKKKLSELSINILKKSDDLEFFMNDGYFGSLAKRDESYKKIVLDKNDIVINPILYDFIFDTKIEWESLNFLYNYGIHEGKPYTNVLPHLGETVSFTIINKGNKIEFSNVKVVGVCKKFYESDKTYKEYIKLCFIRLHYENS